MAILAVRPSLMERIVARDSPSSYPSPIKGEGIPAEDRALRFFAKAQNDRGEVGLRVTTSAASDGVIVTGHGGLFRISSPQRGERTKVRGFLSVPRQATREVRRRTCPLGSWCRAEYEILRQGSG